MKQLLRTVFVLLSGCILVGSVGCSVKVKHSPLKPVATRGSGTVNLARHASGELDVIGFGTITAFFIPCAPVTIQGDPKSEIMLQVKDALEHAGYGVRFVDAPPNASCGSEKVLHCRVTNAGFHNYTYFFPLVPTWGTLQTEVTLVSQGRILWRKNFKGGGFTLNFFSGFTDCVRYSMTKNLNSMAAAFAEPEFRAAIGTR